MNLAQAGLAVAVALSLLGAIVAVVVPRRIRSAVVGTATTLCGAAGVLAGVAAVTGQGFTLSLPGLLPLSGVAITVDMLGGIFVAVTGAVAVAVGIYSIGYCAHGADTRLVAAVLPLFVVAMLLVPTASSVGTLLLCWELMAIASLVLVITEHRHRIEVVAAGRWYAVMTHLGLVALLIGLMLFAAHADSDSFAALRARAMHLPPGVASLVFVLVVVGFGSKAGIVPLHAWLPRAHPEAPSHVSALMSAAMVNLGVYGIVRVGFDLLGGGRRWWWLLVLLLGAISAVYGMLQAVMSTDLKRLLGYSTTENMGLVLVGVGAAGLFVGSGDRVLAGLALTAALLHVVNHCAFKTLLFLAAGSVVRATGSRDLDVLGGLRVGMPVTTAAFGWGGLAASALPPGTAFVSEWLLLQALIHGLSSGGVTTAVVLPVAVAAVALTTGLAVATFVKAFGVGFLARARGSAAARATESPLSMLTAMALAGVACAVLALLPTAALTTVARVASNLVGSPAAPVTGAVALRLGGVAGSLSPLLLTAALLASAVVTVSAIRLVSAGPARRGTRLWDCGAGPLSARMEYTATSFAEPLQRVFDNVVAPETDVDITHYQESSYLVAAVQYRRRVPDRIEHRLYRPVVDAVVAWGELARGLATGSVHRYLGYGFYTVCALLLLLAVAR